MTDIFLKMEEDPACSGAVIYFDVYPLEYPSEGWGRRWRVQHDQYGISRNPCYTRRSQLKSQGLIEEARAPLPRLARNSRNHKINLFSLAPLGNIFGGEVT